MLHFKKGHDKIVGSVHWVLGTSESRYIKQIIQIIQQITESNNETIIGMDQNVDFLKINENKHSLDLHNAVMSLEILPVITKPTWITHSTAILIDNIYLSKKSY